STVCASGYASGAGAVATAGLRAGCETGSWGLTESFEPPHEAATRARGRQRTRRMGRVWQSRSLGAMVDSRRRVRQNRAVRVVTAALVVLAMACGASPAPAPSTKLESAP